MDWHRFLARPPLPSPSPGILDAFLKECILITGAGGSIGSALSLRLARLRPRGLVLLDSSKSRLSGLEKALASSNDASSSAFVLGNVADPSLLQELFATHKPTLVFHAAAFKHVPLLEGLPFAAVENNVFATKALVSLASVHLARVLLLSTDKAVEPVSILGATKRIAELIVRSAGGTVLRLGNVLASSDSVAEVFARQLANHKPLTVTDPAARRYFLTIDEAVSLLLSASWTSGPTRVFAPALSRQHHIADLARFLARELAPGREPSIEFYRLRPGEKECEALWSRSETAGPRNSQGLVPVMPPPVNSTSLHRELAALGIALDTRNLPAVVEHLKRLVPDYTPSETIAQLSLSSETRVAS
jgi:FlaA1/EpsC-like NDP-sugar epimerase